MKWTFNWLLEMTELRYQEENLAMMLARFITLVSCIFLLVAYALLPLLHAQTSPSSTNTSIAVQQALTQQQVIDQAVTIAQLKADLESQRQTTTTLRDDLSSVKGIGIGAAAVIGLLQSLQMILQVKAVKRPI